MDSTPGWKRVLPRAVAALVLATASLTASALDPTVDAVRMALQKDGAEPAVEAAERATRARPKDADAWYYAGQAFGKMAMQASMLAKPGWASRTREAFQTAARLDPRHLGAREGLVQFYTMAPSIMGGGKDKAAAEVASLATLDPAAGHYLRSALKGSDAERELRAAVRLAPGESRYRRALAGALERNQRVPEALLVIDAGLERAPGDLRLLYALGRHAAVHGERVDDGVRALDRIIASPAAALPDDVPLGGAHWRRGQLREKRGDRDAALADYRRAVALSPRLADAKKDLARLGGRSK